MCKCLGGSKGVCFDRFRYRKMLQNNGKCTYVFLGVNNMQGINTILLHSYSPTDHIPIVVMNGVGE